MASSSSAFSASPLFCEEEFQLHAIGYHWVISYKSLGESIICSTATTDNFWQRNRHDHGTWIHGERNPSFGNLNHDVQTCGAICKNWATQTRPKKLALYLLWLTFCCSVQCTLHPIWLGMLMNPFCSADFIDMCPSTPWKNSFAP